MSLIGEIINYYDKTMSSIKKRIFIDSAIVSFANILDKLIFFAINVIVARYLNVNDFGEYSTALGYATFFSIFTNVGINQALIRAVNLESGGEDEHFGNTLFAKTILSVIVYAVMSLSLLLANYNANTIYLILILGIVRIGNEYMAAFYSLYDAKEKFKLSSFFMILFALTLLAATVIVIMSRGDYFAIVEVRMAIVLFIIVLLILFTLRDFRLRYRLRTVKELIKQSIPFGLYIIYFNLIQRLNIIILSMMHGTMYAGTFSNGYIFLISLVFVPAGFNRVIVPFLYKLSHVNDRNKYQFAFDVFNKLYGVISFYIFIIFFLFSREIIITFFSDKYIDSINILKIISFAVPFLFNFASIIITTTDNQRENSRILRNSIIINTALNFILIYFYKSEGAAVASVITFVYIYILSYRYLFIQKIFSLSNFFYLFKWLTIISAVSISAHRFLFTSVHWIISLVLVSLLYAILLTAAVIRKDDIRIIRDILRKKAD